MKKNKIERLKKDISPSITTREEFAKELSPFSIDGRELFVVQAFDNELFKKNNKIKKGSYKRS